MEDYKPIIDSVLSHDVHDLGSLLNGLIDTSKEEDMEKVIDFLIEHDDYIRNIDEYWGECKTDFNEFREKLSRSKEINIDFCNKLVSAGLYDLALDITLDESFHESRNIAGEFMDEDIAGAILYFFNRHDHNSGIFFYDSVRELAQQNTRLVKEILSDLYVSNPATIELFTKYCDYLPRIWEVPEIHMHALAIGDKYTLQIFADEAYEVYCESSDDLEIALNYAYAVDDCDKIKNLEYKLGINDSEVNECCEALTLVNMLRDEVSENFRIRLPKTVRFGKKNGNYASIRYNPDDLEDYYNEFRTSP